MPRSNPPVPQTQKLLQSKTDPIAVVGAGIFGLSTAIHLAERGYTNVTIFDRQPYHETLYSFDKGCDAASADRNKIIRCAYGTETLYQNLTLRALKHWEAWNRRVSSASPVSSSLPPGFDPSTKIYVNNGLLHIPEPAEQGPELSQFELDSIKGITEEGFGHTQYVLSKPEERARAERDGFGFAVNPFRTSRQSEKRQLKGLLDTAGGTVYADRACRFALWQAEKLGVKTVFGPEQGAFESFIEGGHREEERVIGIRTRDGRQHNAALVVMAAGGWTPTLLGGLMDGLAETTCGTVAFVRIPKASPLWHKYAPERFPVWTFQARKGDNGGAYGFPRDEEGIMKVAYRGTKYTNPVQQPDGLVRSEPVTKYSGPKVPEDRGKSRIDNEVPLLGLGVLKRFLNDYMPELGREGIHIEGTRLCWYTDTFDNHYLIDAVPGKAGVMVATGGSGHAFKMLPIIGSEVVDRIEGKATDALRTWAWRELGKGGKADNLLMEGKESRRSLWNVELSRKSDFKLGAERSAKL